MGEPYQQSARKIVQDKNVKRFVTPEQKRQRRMALIVIIIISATACGGYFLLVPKEKTYALAMWDSAVVQKANLPQIIQAGGTVSIPVQMIVLSSQPGYASSLLVEIGDLVEEGQLLAEIDVPDLQEQLSDLELDLVNKQMSVRKTVIQNEISNARKRRQIENSKADLTDEIIARDKLKKYVASNASKLSELEAQEEKIADLRDDIAESQLQLEEDIRLQKIELEMTNLSLQQLQTSIERLKIEFEKASPTSPINGEVLELDASLGVPGTLIKQNLELFTIADTSTAMINLEVNEEYAGTLVKEQEVKLKVSGTSLTGRITNIGRVAQTSSDGLGATIAVQVQPNTVTAALIPGATVVGEIEIGVLQDVLLLPRGPYLTTGSQRYLYVIDSKKAVQVDATFGKSEGNYIQVVEGVSAGDEVIISGYQNYIEFKTIKLERGE